MKLAPIIPALDLWSLGHSASQIAEMLGFPNHKHVTRIIERARSIGDKRAVLHVAANGRLIGRPGRMQIPPVAIAVPALPGEKVDVCSRGHARTPDNVDAGRHCKVCEQMRKPAAPKRMECSRGHPRTVEAHNYGNRCRECIRLRRRLRYETVKK